MLPLRDDKIHNATPSFVTWALILVNAAVFFYQLGMPDTELRQFFFDFGTLPVEILRGDDLWTLLTSMFMHGGWMHIIGNMLFLWVFGDNIEHVMGHGKFLAFYLLGGLAASLGHIFANPESAIPSLGASGAISAVLGAYLVMFPRARVTTLVPFGFFYVTRIPALFFLGLWAIQQFISGIADLGATTAQTSGVAWWAHIGGFVAGLVAGVVFRGRAADVQFIEEGEVYQHQRQRRFPHR